MTANHLQNAAQIGSDYPGVALSYSPDDNTYTERPVKRAAWACPLAKRPSVAVAQPVA